MIALKQAVATLDGVIPPPDNKMVDVYHMPIAIAWQECKKALASYDDMRDKHDTLMRRWEGMVETIRKKIDAGTLTSEDRRLLDDLNLPHRYDKRRNALQENAPLTLEELRGMDGEPVWCETIKRWGIIEVDAFGEWKEKPFIHGTSFNFDIEARGLTVYRRKPEVCGK